MSFAESCLLLYPPSAYETQITRQICDNIDLGMDLVGRPLNQEETDAFVSQAENLVKTPRRGAILGLAAGTALTIYPIRHSFQKGGIFRLPAAFPFWKLGATSGIGIFAGAILGNVISAATASQRLLSDSRLTRFREERKTQNPDAVMQRIKDRAMSRAGSVSQTRPPQAIVGQGLSRPEPTDTDAVGMEDKQSNNDGEYHTDSPIVRDVYSQRQNQWKERQPQSQSSSFYEPPNKSGGDDVLTDLMDDRSSDPNSPAYGGASYERSRFSSRQSSPGSAWERLRHEAAQGAGAGAGSGADSNASNSVTISPSLRESQRPEQVSGETLQRENAQREFDELLERERRQGQ